MLEYLKKHKEFDGYTRKLNGKYKHIMFSIVHWTTPSSLKENLQDIFGYNYGIWNSYIKIWKKSIPRDFDRITPVLKKDRFLGSLLKYYDYGSLDQYFSMSGGISYFELQHDEEGIVTGFEVGNDYNHIWNKHTTFETVFSDVKESIDYFINHFPNYKVHSYVDGKWIMAKNIEKYNIKANQKLKSKFS